MTINGTTDGLIAASASNLTKTYGAGEARVLALDHVTVRFRKGEMTAIVGASGSGKSTLLHCMSGFDEPDEGSSIINSIPVQSLGKSRRSEFRRRSIGFIFQQYGLIPVLTCRENILLPMSLDGKRYDRDRMKSIVDSLGLTNRLEHMPSELSGGQQQKTALARVLLQRPPVVLADEPTGSLDVKSTGEVLRLLRSMVDDLGLTVIMVTHSMDAAQLSDRGLVLSDGRITDDIEHPKRNDLEDAMTRAADLSRITTGHGNPARADAGSQESE
jgi:putative ABC transport system ATP-binding protein